MPIGDPHASPLRWALLCYAPLLVTTACATPREAAVNTPEEQPALSTSSYVNDLDAYGDDFWRAIRDGDEVAFWRNVAGHLKRPPRREVFDRALALFIWENGRPKSWHMTSKAIDGDEERRRYELECTRSTVNAVLTFHRKTRHITNVEVEPRTTYTATPMAGVEAAVTWTDVTVGPALGATIASPRHPTAAKLPAVVLIGGGGPLDRDESDGPIRPFRDLGDGLASRGIVTIRFDKRAFARPQTLEPRFTLDDDLINDGLSAVAVLRREPLVDSSRVLIVGHGLGGLAAIEIAHRSGDLAGLVMVGVPARPLIYVTLERLRDMDPDENVMARAAVDVQAIADGSAPPHAPVLGVPAAFWYDLAKRDLFEDVRTLGCPVLLVRGEVDEYASANDHQRWLQQLRGKQARNEEVPIINHLLVPPISRALTHAEIEAGAAPTIPKYVLDMLADFVTKAPARRSQPSGRT
jgi:pimeloyl-ACP methyl ester carboxylesterase